MQLHQRIPGMLLLVLLAGGPAVRAAETNQVDRLLEVMNLEQTLTASLAQLTRALFAANPDLNLHQDIVVDYLEEHLAWEKLKPEIAKIYAEQFTPAEVGELIRFYASPTGQKALKAGPALAERMQALVQTRFEADLAVLEARMKNRELDSLLEQATFYQDKPTAPAQE